MSEIKLVIRDSRRDISGTCHAAFADRAVAALCDEPETIAELEAALERFEAPDEAEAFRLFNPGIDDQPHDAGVVIIDLPGRWWHMNPHIPPWDRKGGFPIMMATALQNCPSAFTSRMIGSLSTTRMDGNRWLQSGEISGPPVSP